MLHFYLKIPLSKVSLALDSLSSFHQDTTYNKGTGVERQDVTTEEQKQAIVVSILELLDGLSYSSIKNMLSKVEEISIN